MFSLPVSPGLQNSFKSLKDVYLLKVWLLAGINSVEDKVLFGVVFRVMLVAKAM